jgi:preprotein translocase subunit Sec61beta
MADDRIRLPSSMGGLVSYTSEYDSKIQFRPAYVIVFCIIVILIAVFLHLYASAILGI